MSNVSILFAISLHGICDPDESIGTKVREFLLTSLVGCNGAMMKKNWLNQAGRRDDVGWLEVRTMKHV